MWLSYDSDTESHPWSPKAVAWPAGSGCCLSTLSMGGVGCLCGEAQPAEKLAGARGKGLLLLLRRLKVMWTTRGLARAPVRRKRSWPMALLVRDG